jgi:hypothetical protein
VCRRNRFERLAPGTKLVTRPSRFGNYVASPRVRLDLACHATAVALYEAWLMAPEQTAFRVKVQNELRGFNLACSCPLDVPCHADVLLRVANDS